MTRPVLHIASAATALSLAVLMVPWAPTLAQEPPLLKAGARVRIVKPTADGGIPVATGKLLAVVGDTVSVVAGATGYATFVLGPDRRLDVFAGHDHAAAGAVVGALVGAGIGAAVGIPSNSNPCPNQTFAQCLFQGPYQAPPPDKRRVLGAAVGGILGAVGGFLIGRAVKSGTWLPVRGRTTTLRMTPGRIGVSLTF